MPRVLLVLALALIAACTPYASHAPASVSPLPSPSPSYGAETPASVEEPPLQEIVPPSRDAYSSEALPVPPAEGTAAAAERSFERVFQARGDTFRADGCLAQLAMWIATRGELPADSVVVDAMARRVGYAGPTPWVIFLRATGGAMAEAPIEEQLRGYTASLPRNIPIMRYGIGIAGNATENIVFAFAPMELELSPVSKHASREQTLHLRGAVGERFTRAVLSITHPNGTVKNIKSPGRAFDKSITVPEVGRYRIELFGDGVTGPVVLANFPVYVGVREPEPPATMGASPKLEATAEPVTSKSAAQRIFTLLGEARAQAHLPTLKEDDELAALALAHTEDMAAHGFFGHVSPTTGSPDDRFRRANLRFPLHGENIAQGSSADEAYHELMESPGHRANMLQRGYTHVGIATVIRSEFGGQRIVLVTLAFARRLSSSSRRGQK